MTTDKNPKKRTLEADAPPAKRAIEAEAPPAKRKKVEAPEVPIWERPMQKVEQPKKKKRATRPPIDASVLSLAKHIAIGPKKKNSHGGYLCGLSTNAANGGRVIIMFNGGSIHYKWGYEDADQYGKKYLKVNLPDDINEQMTKFDTDYHKEIAVRGFIKGATTPDEVSKTVASLTKAGELKNEEKPEEGRWARTMKMTIPFDANGNCTAKIVDEDGMVIPEEDFESLMGRTVIRMIVKSRFIWYKGKNEAGIATDLVSIVVGPPSGDADAGDYDDFMQTDHVE